MPVSDDLDAQLEERLTLVSQPGYEGEPMTGRDYASVLLLCAALPLLLLLVAGALL